MKIGVYVGSFNPIHIGHMNIIKYLLNNGYIDKIYIVPTQNYWDKTNLIDIKKRIDMLKYIESDQVCIDTINNDLKYTYEILSEYNKKYKKEEIYLIIGADNIISFNKWNNIEEILKYSVIVLNRNNIDIMYYIKEYEFDISKFIVINDYPYIDISSSKIRDNIECNEDYLDSKVYRYIKDNNLYNNN